MSTGFIKAFNNNDAAAADDDDDDDGDADRVATRYLFHSIA